MQKIINIKVKFINKNLLAIIIIIYMHFSFCLALYYEKVLSKHLRFARLGVFLYQEDIAPFSSRSRVRCSSLLTTSPAFLPTLMASSILKIQSRLLYQHCLFQFLKEALCSISHKQKHTLLIQIQTNKLLTQRQLGDKGNIHFS